MFKVCALNCRGLNESHKRLSIYNECLQYDISFLQETYITNAKADSWKDQWMGNFFHVNGTNNSNGLITLFKPGSICENHSILYSSERIIGVSATINGEIYCFYNCYGTTVDNEKERFINKLYHALSFATSDNIVIAGDFNIMMNNSLDNIAGKPHLPQHVKLLNNFVNNFSLVDSWRLQHGSKKEFTWSRGPQPFIARRLDYIFLHESISSSISFTNITYNLHSDHKKVSCHFTVDAFKRGKSYWKLNVSVLQNIDYVNFMNSEIEEFLKDDFDDPNEKLDLLKVMVKSKTIFFCQKENFSLNNDFKQLEKDIAILNEAVIHDPNNASTVKSLEEKKKKIELIEKHRTRGTIIRTKLKDINEGEKNNSYFLNFEKAKSKSNTVTILNEDDKLFTNHIEILHKLKSHFQVLSSPDSKVTQATCDGINEYLSGAAFPSLSDDEVLQLEQEITQKEISTALSKLDNKSSPGIDGIPAEWYKCFYAKIKDILLDSFKYSIAAGKLSILQSRGVIILTPKGKDARKDKIKNWRPITLTNSDYKIFSKVIALRLQKVLDTIIHINQSGFMRGRSIADHIRYIDDILNLTSAYNIDGMLISLDYEKAFDSINKDSIIAAMRVFGFGEYFIKCVTTMLYFSESCVQNGGWLSSFFPTTRGVKQGCCASPLLFLIIVEIMAIRIRESDNIKGINLLSNGEVTPQAKILQYCDDTTLILNSLDDLVCAINAIDSFYLISGLKLNKEKSMGIWIGGSRNKENFPTIISWKTKNDYLKILGVYFNPFVEASKIELNWLSKIDKAKSIIKQLEKRKVSILGRILLCKTYVHSLFSYVLQSLSLPKKVMEEIDSICFKYIWKSKSNSTKVIEKIKRSVMCLNLEDGGSNMIKICDQQQLFLIKWVKRTAILKDSLLCTTNLSEIYLSWFGEEDYFLDFNCAPEKLVFPKFFSKFWSDIIYCYLGAKSALLSLNDNTSTTPIQCEPLFRNKNITDKNETLFFKSWINAGLKYVYQMKNGDRFKTYTEVSDIVGPYPNLLFEYVILTAILKRYTKNVTQNEFLNTGYNIKQKLPMFFKLSNKNQRKLLTRCKNPNLNICGYSFWSNHLSVDILPHYASTIQNVKEIKMRYLLFRIFHNIFPTNVLLSKYKWSDTNRCKCGEIDYADHYFINCKLLKDYWRNVKNHILNLANFSLPDSTAIKLFGLDPNYNEYNISKQQYEIINYILLIAKSAISTAKYHKSDNYLIYFESDLNLRSKYFEYTP